jgi:lipopolysaccharide transport system ATP-binding protein
MNRDIAIRVEGLGKKFCPALRRSLLYATLDIAAEIIPAFSSRTALRRGEFWALRGVSFDVRRGEALALVGHNGAGKSTLLKILYGLLKADTGSVSTQGRVIALIELGAGINPVLTGRENIVLLALLHGLTRSAARNIVDEVLDFSEIGPFAEAAVQTYSAGMRARLSYAIGAVLRPDVLLVDEVLAVGDLAFQRKCITHMRRFIAGGGTLVLVSHAPHHVQSICSRAILMDGGEVMGEGDPAHVVRRYLDLRPVEAPSAAYEPPLPAAPFRIGSVDVAHCDGGTARSGEAALLRISYDATEAMNVYCGAAVWTQDGWTCVTATFDRSQRAISPGPGVMECEISRLPLVPGRYLVRPIVADCMTHTPIPLGGLAHAGEAFDVAGSPDLFSNGQMQLGQLVTLDADWRRDGWLVPGTVLQEAER